MSIGRNPGLLCHVRKSFHGQFPATCAMSVVISALYNAATERGIAPVVSKVQYLWVKKKWKTLTGEIASIFQASAGVATLHAAVFVPPQGTDMSFGHKLHWSQFTARNQECTSHGNLAIVIESISLAPS